MLLMLGTAYPKIHIMMQTVLKYLTADRIHYNPSYEMQIKCIPQHVYQMSVGSNQDID